MWKNPWMKLQQMFESSSFVLSCMMSLADVGNLNCNKHPNIKLTLQRGFLVQSRSGVQSNMGKRPLSANRQHISQNSLQLDEIMNAAVEQTTSLFHQTWGFGGALDQRHQKGKQGRNGGEVLERELKGIQFTDSRSGLQNTRDVEERWEVFLCICVLLKNPGRTEGGTRV